jgi:drug/metabolite transporter (DMT)-like permease
MDRSVNKYPGYRSSPNLIGYTAVITAAAFWGAAGIFVKLIADNETISATALAFWRDLATFICQLFLGLTTIPSKMRIRRADWRDMAGMGACLGAFHDIIILAFCSTAQRLRLQTIMPAIVTVAARYLWQEALTRHKILAILLAFAGSVLVAGLVDAESAQFTFTGLLLGFSVPCLYAGWNLFGKI